VGGAEREVFREERVFKPVILDGQDVRFGDYVAIPSATREATANTTITSATAAASKDDQSTHDRGEMPAPWSGP